MTMAMMGPTPGPQIDLHPDMPGLMAFLLRDGWRVDYQTWDTIVVSKRPTGATAVLFHLLFAAGVLLWLVLLPFTVAMSGLPLLLNIGLWIGWARNVKTRTIRVGDQGGLMWIGSGIGSVPRNIPPWAMSRPPVIPPPGS